MTLQSPCPQDIRAARRVETSGPSRTIVLPTAYPITIRNFEMPVDFPHFLLRNPESALTPEIIDRCAFPCWKQPVFFQTHVSATAPSSFPAGDGEVVL